jgi:hypothetical protein
MMTNTNSLWIKLMPLLPANQVSTFDNITIIVEVKNRKITDVGNPIVQNNKKLEPSSHSSHSSHD